MKKTVLLVVFLAVVFLAAESNAYVASFSAQDVINTMSAAGAPLADATNQWGLWAVRVMPIVGGTGNYTITGGLTTRTGWGVSAPNGAVCGASPYTATNSVWFSGCRRE